MNLWYLDHLIFWRIVAHWNKNGG